MQITFNSVLLPLAALLAGAVVGLAFGLLQDTAWRRYQKQEQSGQFKSAWGVMPGSMQRVACLLIALALVQWLCPMLFSHGTQWWVSGGVVAGYGAVLLRQFRLRMAVPK